jgi:hypothetical protein
MSELTKFEQDVMRMLLEGDDPVLVILREQARSLVVSGKKATGVGFYIDFAVDPAAPRCTENQSFEIGDVVAKMDGLEQGAGFILFVRDGVLSFLEGFTYDEPWPESIVKYDLSYKNGQRDCHKLYEKLRGP